MQVIYNDENQLTPCDFALLVPVDTPTPADTPGGTLIPADPPSEILMPADTPSEILMPANSPLDHILVRPLDEQVEYGIHTPAINEVTGLAIPADEHHKDPTMSLEYEDQSIGVQTSPYDMSTNLFLFPNSESIFDAPALVHDEPMDLISMLPENQYMAISIPADEGPLEEALLPSDTRCIKSHQQPSSDDMSMNLFLAPNSESIGALALARDEPIDLISMSSENQYAGISIPADEGPLEEALLPSNTGCIESHQQPSSSDDMSMNLLSSNSGSIDALALTRDEPIDLINMSPENQYVGISIPTEEVPSEEALLPSDTGCIESHQQPSSSTDYKSARSYFRAVDPHREYIAALASRDQVIRSRLFADEEPVNPSTTKDEGHIGPLTPADAACSQEITAYTPTEHQPDDLMPADEQPTEAVPIPIHSPTMDHYPHLDEIMVATARARAGEVHYPREVPREEGYRYRFVRNVIATVVRPQNRIMRGVDELTHNTAMARLEPDPDVLPNIECEYQVPDDVLEPDELPNIECVYQVPDDVLEPDVLPDIECVYQIPNYVHQVPCSGPLEVEPWYVDQVPLNIECVNQAPINPEDIDGKAPLILINEYVDRDEPSGRRLRVDDGTSDLRETDGVVKVSGQRRLLATSEIENQRRRMTDAIQLMIMLGKSKAEGEEPPPLGEETPQPLDVGVEDHQLQIFELPDPGIGLFENIEPQEQYEIFQVPEVQEKMAQVPKAQEGSRVPDAQAIWDPEVGGSVETQMGISGVPEAQEGGEASMYHFGGSDMGICGSQEELMQEGPSQVSTVQEDQPLQVAEVQVCNPETQSYESPELQVHMNIPQIFERQEEDFQLPQGNVEGSPGLEAEFRGLEVNRYELQFSQALRELPEVPEALGEVSQALEVDCRAAVPLINPEVQRHESEGFPDWGPEVLIRFGSEEPVLAQEEKSQIPEERAESEDFPDWDPEVLIRFGSEEPVLAQEETFQISEEREESSQVLGLGEETLSVPGGNLEGEVSNESQEPQQALEEMAEGLEALDEGLKEISEALDQALEEMSEGPEVLDEGLRSPTPDLQYDDSEVQETYECQKPERHSTMYQIPQTQACDLEAPRYESQGPHSQASEAEEEEHLISVIESESQDVQRYENQKPHMPREMSQALETQEQMSPVLGARKKPQLPENKEWHPVVKRHCLQGEGSITSPGPEIVQVWHTEIQMYESHDPQSSERSQTPETQEGHPSPFLGIPNWFPDRPRLSQEPLQLWDHQSQRSDSQQAQTSRETSRSRAPQGQEQKHQLPGAQLGDPEVQRDETQWLQTSRVISPVLEEQEQDRQISEAREEGSQSPWIRDRHRQPEGPAEGPAYRISEEQEEPETNIPGIQEWYTPIEAEHRMSEEQETPETNIPGIEEWYPPIEAEARRMSEERKVSEAREEVRRAAKALEKARQVLEAREKALWVSEAREESQLPGIQELHPEPRREDSQESEASRETTQTPEAQEGELPVYRMHGAREVSEPQDGSSEHNSWWN